MHDKNACKTFPCGHFKCRAFDLGFGQAIIMANTQYGISIIFMPTLNEIGRKISMVTAICWEDMYL